MPKFEDIGAWVKATFGTQAKAAKALGTRQNVISQWVSGRNRPSEEAQALLRRKGYDGPFVEPARARESQAGGPYVTEAAFEAWRKFWYEGQERVLKNYEDRLKDLTQRIEQLEKGRE